jgi:hypothetical protein
MGRKRESGSFKTDPYRKARSMDVANQPFMSQPALVNGGSRPPARELSTDSSNTPPSSFGLSNPLRAIRRHSGQNQVQVTFNVGQSKGKEKDTTNNTHPVIDGLPALTDAGSALGISSIQSPTSTQSKVATTPSLPPIDAGSPIVLNSSNFTAPSCTVHASCS